MANIVDIKGIGPASAKSIAESGFDTVEKIAAATPAELATAPGIGEARAARLIAAAQALLGDASEPAVDAQATSEAGGEGKPAKEKSDKKDKKSSKKKSEKKKKKKKKKKK